MSKITFRLTYSEEWSNEKHYVFCTLVSQVPQDLVIGVHTLGEVSYFLRLDCLRSGEGGGLGLFQIK